MGNTNADEQAMIDRVLMSRFALSPDQARGLRDEGEQAEAESIDIYQFTKAITHSDPA